MMYALEPRVHDPVFELIEHLIPQPEHDHPLGCHRRRVPDRVIFHALLLRLITGEAWETIEFLIGRQASDTTIRTRRDEWVDAGVFEQLVLHAFHAYKHVIGFDLNNVFIDGCNNRALAGGAGTGLDPKHPGKRGWKFVIITDANGIPITLQTAAANRQDYPLMFATLDDLAQRDQLRLIGTLHADRGFNYTSTPHRLANDYNLNDFQAPTRNPRGTGRRKRSPLGPRWIVESTNSWLRSYKQIAHNTDRHPHQRQAALCFAITLLITHRISHPQHSTWRPIR